MQNMDLDRQRQPDPGDLIADRALRELHTWFLSSVCGIDDDIELRPTRLETRVYFGNRFLCRVVPYQALFHVQIGEKNPWEIRVRDEASCLETFDGVLAEFLERYISREPHHSAGG